MARSRLRGRRDSPALAARSCYCMILCCHFAGVCQLCNVYHHQVLTASASSSGTLTVFSSCGKAIKPQRSFCIKNSKALGKPSTPGMQRLPPKKLTEAARNAKTPSSENRICWIGARQDSAAAKTPNFCQQQPTNSSCTNTVLRLGGSIDCVPS